MRIIIVNKVYSPRGGDSVYTIGLQKILESYGHKVAIFSMMHPENLENSYSDYWPSRIDYSTGKIKNPVKAVARPLYSIEVKNKWNLLINSFKPDIVHLNNIHTSLSPIIAKEAYKMGIPVYWTLHDLKLICPAYLMLRDGSPCEKCISNKKYVVHHRCIKNSLAGSILAYFEALLWSREKLEKYTTRFIAPSKFLKNKMMEAGFSEETLSQVYNFTGDENFVACTIKKNYFVFVGRISEEKGILTLLEASEKLPEFNLKVIGDGPLLKELKDKFKSQHIEFLGRQPWKNIKPILSEARFLVLPSECYENNPLSIIESLALGTPVLGANRGGIPELIETEKNGMLFSSGDKEDLKKMIKEMMSFKTWDYNEISTQAQALFNTEKYYNELDKLYTTKN